MAKTPSDGFAATKARQKVGDLYRKLRDDAVKMALSTFGAADPDIEQVEKELGNKPEE
tara:strand:- start:4350 stop:4523 length:174 start_codon:yes stop_codon:yes gene_type:complete